MAEFAKGKSPFYPGQPVPVELFVGRDAEIERIMTRGVHQVALGKPVTLFVQGEYGIGKSSVAGFTQWLAEQQYGLHGVYVPLGGAETMDDLAAAVLQATVQSGAFHSDRAKRIRNWLARYVGEQTLFGVRVDLKALRSDAPTMAKPVSMLEFLGDAFTRLEDTGVKGLFLVLDEINGITTNRQFAHFVKGLIDSNALTRRPVPLLLMLCGVEERRREMIDQHQPIDRVFDVVEIGPMPDERTREFFTRAFESVQMSVQPEAMEILTRWSAGFPKIMHLVGDAAYWLDRDGTIDTSDASTAVTMAAEDVGKKYVDQQVYRALRSPDYHSILDKIARLDPASMMFRKAEVAAGLTETERRKFGNFLHKMKRLGALRSGNERGQYIFNVCMVRLYIWLQSMRGQKTRR